MADHKIKTLAELSRETTKYRDEKKKVVLALGHFNVIHPGHLRFLNFARAQGDYLVIAVLGDNKLDEMNSRHFFKQEERAQGVASIEIVDAIILLDTASFKELTDTIKPEIYVKGREFEDRLDLIRDEIDFVKSNGGKVLFHSGEVQYASTEIFDHKFTDILQEKADQLKDACRRREINLTHVKKQLEEFSNLNMLVIGDSIVDQFVACDALGMSSEAPVLAIRELEEKQFIGGAAIIACHLKALSANSHFISITGRDEPGRFLKKQLTNAGVENVLLTDPGRPTSFKIRYMVNNQKLLRVSRLQEHSVNKDLEGKIIKALREMMPKMDGVIVADFVYGVITETILAEIIRLAKKHNVRLFGDLQCSSQVGNVGKFVDFDLITPTEKEARIALQDNENGLEKVGRKLMEKTNCNNLLITLAENGMVAYQKEKEQDDFVSSQFFPALVTNPVDVAGAGDSLLSGVALSLCAKNDLMQASIIGSCLAAITVNRIGNTPVTLKELENYLNNLGRVIGKKGYLLN